MKDLNYLNKYRKTLYGLIGDESNGMFQIPIDNKLFCIIASNGMGWDHISVTLSTLDVNPINRCPKWNEMCIIKEMFFEDDEVVMQLHPKKEDYVNDHPYCLHLWKPQKQEIPTPPTFMVGNSKKYSYKNKGN